MKTLYKIPEEGVKETARPARVARLRLLVVVALTLALLFLVLVGYSGYVIWTYGERPAARADVAIVLGAAAWGDEPSPVFRERINHALALHSEGKVEHLLFTGGTRHPGRPAEAEVAALYALRQGLPSQAILKETKSWTTATNLTEAKALMARHGLHSAYLVSDPLHLKRAVVLARYLEMTVSPAGTPTTMYRSRASRLRFLSREARLYTQYLLGRAWRAGTGQR